MGTKREVENTRKGIRAAERVICRETGDLNNYVQEQKTGKRSKTKRERERDEESYKDREIKGYGCECL